MGNAGGAVEAMHCARSEAQVDRFLATQSEWIAEQSEGAAAMPPAPAPIGQSAALWWTTAEVVQWLKAIAPAYSAYATAFEAAGVNGPALLTTSEALLSAMGVDNVIHRNRLLSGIAVLRMGLSDAERAALPSAVVTGAQDSRKRKADADAPAAAAAANGPVAKRARTDAVDSIDVEMTAAEDSSESRLGTA
jgi:hypothetical protein